MDGLTIRYRDAGFHEVVDVITAAHIHNGPAGKNAGVFIPFTGLPAAGGSFATLNNAPAAKMQDVLSNPSGFYVNVHSMAHPGGEIRGQLACAPVELVASPTPRASSTPAGVPGAAGGSGGLWLGLGGLLVGVLIVVVFGLRKFRGPGSIGSSETRPPPAGSGEGPAGLG